MVEQDAFNVEVEGSSPFAPTKFVGLWCNGNTTDFDSVILGSNPSRPAKYAPFVYRFRTLPFHGRKRGSIPLRCTNNGVYSVMGAPLSVKE